MSDKPLVIVTRPEGAEGRLCEMLVERGFSVRHFPSLATVSISDSAGAAEQVIVDAFEQSNAQADASSMSGTGISGALENLVNSAKSANSRAVFVSANAVNYTAQLVAQLDKSDAALLQEFFCCAPCTGMGLASEQAIVAHGWHLGKNTDAAITSEELMQLDWASAENLAGQTIVLCRGVGGRTYIEQALAARGAKVVCLETYRRLRPVMDADKSRALVKCLGLEVCVTFSSGETAENFFANLGQAWQEHKHCQANEGFAVSSSTIIAWWTFVVPSPRVKEIVRKAAVHFLALVDRGDDCPATESSGNLPIDDLQIIVAANASDSALTNAVATSY